MPGREHISVRLISVAICVALLASVAQAATTVYGTSFTNYYAVHLNNVTGNDATCAFALAPTPPSIPCLTIVRAMQLYRLLSGTNTAAGIILETDIVMNGTNIVANGLTVSLFIGRDECIAPTVDPVACQMGQQKKITCPLITASTDPECVFGYHTASIYLLGVSFYLPTYTAASMDNLPYFLFDTVPQVVWNRAGFIGTGVAGVQKTYQFTYLLANTIVTATNCNFINMTASLFVLEINANVIFTATLCTFSGNVVYPVSDYATTSFQTAVISIFGGTSSFTNCTFYQNGWVSAIASFNAGIISLAPISTAPAMSTLTATNCVFFGNFGRSTLAPTHPYTSRSAGISTVSYSTSITAGLFVFNSYFANNYLSVLSNNGVPGAGAAVYAAGPTVVENSYFGYNYILCPNGACAAGALTTNTGNTITGTTFECNYVTGTTPSYGAMSGNPTEYGNTYRSNAVMYSTSGSFPSRGVPLTQAATTDDGGISCLSSSCSAYTTQCSAGYSQSPSPSVSPSISGSTSPTVTVSLSPSPTASPTSSVTPSNLASSSITPSIVASPSRQPSDSRTPSRSESLSRTPSRSMTQTRSPSRSESASRTATRNASPSRSPSRSPSSMSL